jgi:hypothetical protein
MRSSQVCIDAEKGLKKLKEMVHALPISSVPNQMPIRLAYVGRVGGSPSYGTVSKLEHDIYAITDTSRTIIGCLRSLQYHTLKP